LRCSSFVSGTFKAGWIFCGVEEPQPSIELTNKKERTKFAAQDRSLIFKVQNSRVRDKYKASDIE